MENLWFLNAIDVAPSCYYLGEQLALAVVAGVDLVAVEGFVVRFVAVTAVGIRAFAPPSNFRIELFFIPITPIE